MAIESARTPKLIFVIDHIFTALLIKSPSNSAVIALEVTVMGILQVQFVDAQVLPQTIIGVNQQS